MVVVNHSRAATLAPSGQGPTNLSHTAGFRDQIPCLRVRGEEANQLRAIRFGHQALRVFQKAARFYDRDLWAMQTSTIRNLHIADKSDSVFIRVWLKKRTSVGSEREKMVGARGFEPPASWSRILGLRISGHISAYEKAAICCLFNGLRG